MRRRGKALHKPAALFGNHIDKRARIQRKVGAEISAVSAVDCRIEDIAVIGGHRMRSPPPSS